MFFVFVFLFIGCVGGVVLIGVFVSRDVFLFMGIGVFILCVGCGFDFGMLLVLMVIMLILLKLLLVLLFRLCEVLVFGIVCFCVLGIFEVLLVV